MQTDCVAATINYLAGSPHPGCGSLYLSTFTHSSPSQSAGKMRKGSHLYALSAGELRVKGAAMRRRRMRLIVSLMFNANSPGPASGRPSIIAEPSAKIPLLDSAFMRVCLEVAKRLLNGTTTTR